MYHPDKTSDEPYDTLLDTHDGSSLVETRWFLDFIILSVGNGTKTQFFCNILNIFSYTCRFVKATHFIEVSVANSKFYVRL